MSAARLRLFGLSVAVAALLAGAAAATPEVKGPVHITGRGVETISAAEWASAGDRGEGREEVREAMREARRSAMDAIEEGREAAREAQREAAAQARDAVAEARAAAREAADCARAEAREAREAARAQARKAREIARAAHDDARAIVERAMVRVHAVTGNIQIEIGDALNEISGARLDIVHSAAQLAAAEAGDFSDIVVVSKGVMKCGDVSAHDGCIALTPEDKARLTKELGAALQAAADAMEAAQAGLAAAARADAED